jgi:asparagine synthase (glutamine-hydrolysing)
MLYQEGWGCDSIKHSLTFTGGYSRACVRTYASLRRHGFSGFSPFTCPPVVAAAEAIPFAELTQGSNARLYALKGEILARGVRSVLGLELPEFPKRRFQHGAAAPEAVGHLYAGDEAAFRQRFLAHYEV